MNKSDLIDVIADRLGKTKKDTGEVIEAVLDHITASVASGEKVSLSGFGVFEKQERAARVGRNPRTGATVKIKATAVPKFRSGVDFKATVAGKKRTTKSAAKKTTARKTTAKKTAAKKTTATRAPAARKTAARKTTATRAPAARKTAARKTTATRAPAARKTAARKTTATKATAKKTTARKTARR